MEEFAISKNETRKHILEVNQLISQCIASLILRANNHDATKLGPDEAPYFDEYTPKLANTTYGSDEYKKFLEELKPALDHHYKCNDHHPEHHSGGIQDMSLLEVVEMLCDWKAATLRHNDGDIRKSIELNQSRFGYSDEFKGLLLNTVNQMNW
jgi:hypothetical protein